MSTRWLVERQHENFEDVGHECVKVVDGCLVFRDDPFEPPRYIVAAGEWQTVIRESDDD